MEASSEPTIHCPNSDSSPKEVLGGHQAQVALTILSSSPVSRRGDLRLLNSFPGGPCFANPEEGEKGSLAS